MSRFPFLSQKLFDTPLMIHPQKAEIVMASLADRLGITHLMRGGEPSVLMLAPELDQDVEMMSSRADWKPYVVSDGIAIIPVEGTLVQKTGCLRPYSGMTGYDAIDACFMAALGDNDVRAIMLQIDSPAARWPAISTWWIPSTRRAAPNRSGRCSMKAPTPPPIP